MRGVVLLATLLNLPSAARGTSLPSGAGDALELWPAAADYQAPLESDAAGAGYGPEEPSQSVTALENQLPDGPPPPQPEAAQAEALLSTYEQDQPAPSSRVEEYFPRDPQLLQRQATEYLSSEAGRALRGHQSAAVLADRVDGRMVNTVSAASAISTISRDGVLKFLFFAISGAFFSVVAYRIAISYRNYQRYCAKASKRRLTFAGYLRYKMSAWFSNTEGAALIVIGIVFLFALLLGSCVYYALDGNTSLSTSVHKVIAWLVSPDSGMLEVTRFGAIIGVLLSISGLFIFALTLSLVQEMWGEFLASVNSGTEPIMEADHIVIIGFTDDTSQLINQLALAYHGDEKGLVMAILVNSNASEVESRLKLELPDLKEQNVLLLVRHGSPDRAEALKRVAVHTARLVILMPDRKESKELRDAYTMQALIALKTSKAPSKGRILLMAALPLNVKTFQDIGKENTDVLSLDHVVGNILVSCSENAGLGPVVDNFIGFDGSEMYIGEKVPQHMVGLPFQFAAQYYPHAVVLGCVHASDPHRPQVCVDSGYVLRPGDKLLLLAENALSLEPKPEKDKVSLDFFQHDLMESAQLEVAKKPTKRENILFIGWSATVGLMILKLDRVVKEGSKVFSFHSTPKEERSKLVHFAEERNDVTLQNITMEYIEGDLCSKWQLESLGEGDKRRFDWKDVSRVFIIMDRPLAEPWREDAVTMTVALQLRDTFEQHFNDGVPIVMELHSMHSELQVLELGFQNYVVSSSIPSKVMATVARQPELGETLRQVFSNRGNPVTLRRLEDYIPPEALEARHLSFNFFQLSSIVAIGGDVLIGWTIDDDEADSFADMDYGEATHEEHSQVWEINPLDKQRRRTWHLDIDKLVVIARSPSSSSDQGGYLDALRRRFIDHEV